MTPSELEAIRERCKAARTYPLHNRRHSLIDGKIAPGEGPCAACEFEDHAKDDVLALLAHIASLEADLTAVAEAGDVLSMLFEAHWTVKDTDEAVHDAVANWKAAVARTGVQAVLHAQDQ